MPGPKFIPPEALAKARRLYEETDLPIADIAALLDVNETTVYRRAVRFGWKMRRKHRTAAVPNDVLMKHGALPVEELDSALPGANGEAAEDGVRSADADNRAHDRSFAEPDLEALAARVEEAAKTQIAQVERMLRLEGSAAVETKRGERAARTLASLAQTLASLRRAMKLNTTSEIAEDAIRSDADIRREIAAALERIAAGETSEAAGAPESSGT